MVGLWLLLLLPHGGALLSTALKKGWCSSWGAGHFSTFDHHAYDFLGTCNYIFAASCKGASPTFSIQLRRGADGNISRIIVELGSSVVTVNETTISIKDIGVVSLPYTSHGLQITPYGQSVQLVAKQVELELVVMWGPDAHLMVLVERKYMGQMCGLCGNFDGTTANEFLSEDGKLLEPYKYAALQKLDDPNEICTFEAIPRPPVLQATHVGICTQLLTLVSPECDVPKKPLVLSCQVDMATCAQPGQQNCSCATLSEYSRRCSMAHRPVSNWRGPGLCSVGQCPANQVYQECGTACIRTCSNPQHSCSSPCTFGCFCPKGMVLNDLSNNHTCVPVSQCPCMLNGVAYSPGEVVRAACQSCQCTMGHWTCTGQPCPGHCSLEGGSFVTTFDARPYRFHGTCTYILLQSPQLPNEGTLMAVYDKSGYSHSETSLVAIVYLSGQDKIVISEDEVTNNGDTKWLPYQTRNITIFRQTSTHLQMATTFGLEIVVQRQPVFQVYITLGPQFRGQTRGLCGNFNGNTTDEFTSSAGIDEGTAALFVDSWRAGNCPAALEREIDPCSMSQLNKMYAETHCSVLLKKDGVFEKCHAVLDPKPFYKRCVYQACNYEETFPHICAALGAYVHACSSQAVLLGDWRDSVYNCTIPCTGNRTFSQQSQACDHTCLSLSNREVECHPSAVPVDGCNCPDGTYLDHRNECVHKAQCPCLLESHKFILAGQSTMVNGIICHCTNGRLSCPGQSQVFLASCPAPKTFQSCSQSSEDKFGAACAPTCQMLATGITCVPTKCEPGCVCPEGFYENTSGQCVLPGQCPCDFAGVSYPGGAVLRTDCKNCTCSQGRWTCQQSAHCPSTCILYGEGHIITFDGQRFVFNGNCKYTLATDDCGANSQPSFKILVENVVCGKSEATCSRAIQILLGGLTITMADRNYSISGENSQVHVLVKPSSLNLVLDIDIPNRLNMTLVWNKHMSVSIRVHRASQDALCGLCGNCNGNMKDDFETRSKYVASNELEFVNSWKESPLCRDASYAEDPCSLNPFRRPWAERKCSIIHSQTFTACHSKVYRMPYYEACVRDACLCDKGGDCECLCDAVAAYAKACLDKGVCVDWRAPDFCPIYCDFYNTHSQVGDGKFQYTQEANCTWHYQPCLCPGHLDSFPDTNVEGCYNCSQDEYFDHRTGTCVPCTTYPTAQPSTPASTEDWTLLTTRMPSALSSGATRRSTATGLTVTEAITQATAAPESQGTKSTAQSTARTTEAPPSSRTGTLPSQGNAQNDQESWDQQHRATGSFVTSTTSPASLSHLSSSPHPKPTSPLSTNITPTPTNTQTGTPVAHTSSATHTSTQTSRTSQNIRPDHQRISTSTRSPDLTYLSGFHTVHPFSHTNSSEPHTPHMPWTSQASYTLSASTTAHPSLHLTATPLKTTSPFPNPPTAHTSLTSLVSTLSTGSLTPSSQSIPSPSSPEVLWSTSSPGSTGSSLSTTTVKASGPTSTAPLTTTSTRATTRANTSVTTSRTSTAPLSFHSTTTYLKSTLPLATTIKQTMSAMALTSGTILSTQQIPSTSHSLYTTSASTTARPSIQLTGTSLKTSSTFPTPSGPLTSPTSLASTLSTLSLTPTSQTLNAQSSTQVPSESYHPSSMTTTLSTTVVRATGPTYTSPLITTSTSAPHRSFVTSTTSPASLSHLSSSPHPKPTSPLSTNITPTPTNTQTGTSVAHTSSATHTSTQTSRTSQSSNTASASNTAHPSVPLPGTSVQITSTYPPPPGPQTSLTSRASTLSTPSPTPTPQSLSSPSSPQVLWSTSTPRFISSSPTTTTVKPTAPTATLPLMTTSTRSPSLISTFRTSPAPVPHPTSTLHTKSTLPIATTITQTGSPEALNSVSPHSTPLMPWTSQASYTSSPSTTAHPALHLTATPLKTTSPFPNPTTPNTSLSPLVTTLSTGSLTPSSQSIPSPSSPEVLWSTSSPGSTGSSLSTTTVKASGPTSTAPLTTTSTRATTRANTSVTTSRTSTAPLSFHSTTTYLKSTLPLATTIKQTMSEMALTSGTILSTQQIPLTSHPLYTTSASTTARPSIQFTGTSLKTSSTFPTPSGPQTSPTSLVSTLSTLSLTPTSQTLNAQSSTQVPSESYHPSSMTTTLSTTVVRATRPTYTSPLITMSTSASQRSFVTSTTSPASVSYLASSPYHKPTSPLSTNITPTTTNTQTGTPVAHTSSATHTSTQTSRTSQSSYTPSASNTAHPSVPLPGTSVQITSAYPPPPSPQTSLTSWTSTLSTPSLTPTPQSLSSPSSPQVLWSTSTPRFISSSPTTTTVKPTAPTATLPLMTTSTRASTQAPKSINTFRTSPGPLPHPTSTLHTKSTLPIATTITQTGSPEALNSVSPHSTPLMPWTSQASYTSSPSTTAHPALHLTATPLKTTSPFPNPPTAHTSLTSLLSTLSTVSLTPSSQSIPSPSSPEVLWSTSSPGSTGSSLSTTTVKASGPTSTAPLTTTSTRATTRANTSVTTSRTSTAPLSFHSTTTYLKSTLPLATTIKQTMSAMALTSGTILSTQQIPSTSHPLYTTSASTTARPSIQLTGTSLKTSSTFPTPSGPQTSPTSLVSTLSTLSLTPTSQTLNAQSSTQVPSESYHPSSMTTTLSTTVVRATGRTYTSPLITTSTSAPHRSFVTSTTSPASLSHLFSSPHPKPTSHLSTNITPTPTNTQTGTPVAHTSSATHTSTQTSRTSQSSNTASASNTAHPSVPLPGTSVQITSTYPPPPGPQTSLTSRASTLSTPSPTPTPQSLSSPSSPQVLWSTSTPRFISSSPTTTTVKPTAPTATLPLMTTSTRSPSLISTFRTSPAPVPHPTSTLHTKSTLPIATTITQTGSPEALNSVSPHSTPLMPWTSQASYTSSPSTTAHPALHLTATPLKTTSPFPNPTTPNTSLSPLVTTLSTGSLTPSSQSIPSPSSPEVLWSTSSPGSTGSSLSTTTVKASGPTSTAPLTTTSTRATTRANTSVTTSRTSTAPLSFHSTTTYLKSTLPLATTIKQTMSEMALTSGTILSTQQIPLTSHPLYTTSASTTARPSIQFTGTSLKTSSTFPTPSGPQTSPTSLVSTLSTLSLTPTSQTLNAQSSTQVPSESYHPSSMTTTLSTTVVRATRPTYTSPLITMSTSASQRSFVTSTTSPASVSYLASSPYHKPTSPLSTNITPTTTNTQTGTPVAHTSSATHTSTQTSRTSQNIRPDHQRISTSTQSPDLTYLLDFHIVHPFSHTNSSEPHTPLMPWTSQASYTSSPSTTAHPALHLTATPLKTTSPFPNPPTAHTSLTSLLSTLSTVSLTPSSQSIPSPSSPEVLWSTSSPGSTGSSLSTTTVKASGPTSTAPLTTTSTRATTRANTSVTTSRTSTAPLSFHSTTTYLKSTLPLATTIKQTMSAMALTSGTLLSTQQIPSTSHPLYTTSASTTPRPSIQLTGTSLKTSSTFPTPSGPQTSPTSLVSTLSTLSLTPTSQTLNAQSSTQVPSESYHPSSMTTTLSTTVVRATGPTYTSPLITTSTSASQRSFVTSTTSPASLSHLFSSPHPKPTSLLSTNITPTPTNTQTGTPVAHTSSATHTSTQTSRTSQSSNTASASNTAHPSVPLPGTSVQITSTYPPPPGPQTSLTSRTSTLSTPSLTPIPQSLSSPSSPQFTGTSLKTSSTFPTPSGPQTSPTSLVSTLFTLSLTPTSQTLNAQSSTQYTNLTDLSVFKHRVCLQHCPPFRSPPRNIRPDHQRISTSTRSPDLTYLSGFHIVHPFSHTNSSEPQQPIQPTSALEHLYPKHSTHAMDLSGFIHLVCLHHGSPVPAPHSYAPQDYQTIQPRSAQWYLHPKAYGLQSFHHNHQGHRNHKHYTTDDHFYQTNFSEPHQPVQPRGVMEHLHPKANGHESFNHSREGYWTQKHFTTDDHVYLDLHTGPLVFPHCQNVVLFTELFFSLVLHFYLQFYFVPRSLAIGTPITPSASPSSAFSQSTTSQLTSLTTQASMPGLVSSTLRMTSSTVSPTTNLTSSPPGTSRLLTSMLLSSYITSHGSSSTFPPATPSRVAPSVSSDGACSVQEHEQEITYQGCTANVTLTRCEGACASSVSFNITTQQVDAQCSCCYPLNSYRKQLLLPCADPSAPGQQLKVTLQVFSSCVCQLSHCRD
ncbi:mucin-6 [Marmota flaviventris]